LAARASEAGTLRVGTSGYQYPHWAGRFYPAELGKAGWFAHYARHFDTVEINNTFYRLPPGETFASWRTQAPAGFVYALKYSRYGTHVKRLRNPEQHLPHFVERARRLGRRLGPVLVQLPPRCPADPGRLNAFLAAAPRALRWVLEVRDERWLHPRVYAVLERRGAALCIHDRIDRHPHVLTAPFTYLRYHGPRGDYGGSYRHQRLSADARWMAARLAEGRDVYAYFNNDAEACATANAADLRRYAERALAARARRRPRS